MYLVSYLFVVLTAGVVAISGLSCEVSFRKRIWYPTGLTPDQVDCSAGTTTAETEVPTTAIDTTILPFQNLHLDVENSDVALCHLATTKSASFACGSFVMIDNSCPGQTIEYFIKDCVGHSSETLLNGCELTTISKLAASGTFFFEAETTFADHMMDGHINKETEMTACFCTKDVCNKNETLVVITIPAPDPETTNREERNASSMVNKSLLSPFLFVSIATIYLFSMI